MLHRMHLLLISVMMLHLLVFFFVNGFNYRNSYLILLTIYTLFSLDYLLNCYPIALNTRNVILNCLIFQVGVPGIILRCLDHMELNDLGRPVAFLAKMVCHRPLAFQLVSKGLLDPNRMRRLFDSLGLKEVTLDGLMIISDLARMDKVSFLSLSNGFFLYWFLYLSNALMIIPDLARINPPYYMKKILNVFYIPKTLMYHFFI